MYSSGPTIQKDPNIQRLRQDVADRLWDIVKEQESNTITLDEIKFVSYEEAIKELAALKNL